MTAQQGIVGRAMVRLRPVPISAPAAERWPGVRIRRPIPTDQPPLPWSAEDDRTSDQLTGRLTRAGTVRIVRFGDSWAGPLAAGLPDPGPWSVSLAVGLAEALRGARPRAQLNRWLTDPALAQLSAHPTPRTRSRTPPVLQSVHLQRCAPGIVEAVALFIESGSGVSALAFRLEARTDRWSCTAVETRPTIR
ncbi:Rv3235 family protein [Microlunatus endophyticus]|nr:Rv3235 family protein [Microlunatus endophyticus]